MMRKILNSFVICCIVSLGVSAQQYNVSSDIFGVKQRYRTWSVGVNAGVLSPVLFTGGTNDFDRWKTEFAYGFALKKQLSHVFGLQVNLISGNVSGSNEVNGVSDYRAFETKLSYAADFRFLLNIGAIDFLNRRRSLLFHVAVGAGSMAYNPVLIHRNFVLERVASNGENLNEFYIPVAAGMRLRLSKVVGLSFAYHAYFLDGDLLDGFIDNGASSKDKFSFAAVGLDVVLGKSIKPDLSWENPVRLFYDALRNEEFSKDVKGLKDSLSRRELELTVLQRDSDGDGVADFFDRCPGKVKGRVVDGSGCDLVVPSKRKRNEMK